MFYIYVCTRYIIIFFEKYFDFNIISEDNSLSPPMSSTEVKLEPLDSPLSYLTTPFIPLLNDSSALYASWEDYIPVNTQHSK